MRDVERLALNLPAVDEMYERWRTDPSSVDESWRELFGEMGDMGGASPVPVPVPERVIPEPVAPAPPPIAAATPALTPLPPRTSSLPPPPPVEEDAPRLSMWDLGDIALATAAQQLLGAYRAQGHLAAWLDPLGLRKLETPRKLNATSYALTEHDLDRVVPVPGLWGKGHATLRDILDHLRTTYSSSVGMEFMHITSAAKRAWLCERLESSRPPWVDPETKRFLLERLGSAEAFERFIHTKYVGTKRFSLEGSETLVPCLDLVLEHAALHGAEEVVIGMAHRGRLNVLVHTIGKRPAEIFAEFEDVEPEATLGSGDVKYHLGYSSDRVTRQGKSVHVSLTFNPSHLEAVDPVVVGRVRAKQRRLKDQARTRVVGVLVHGDAAFAGQGLVGETLNLSELHGYRTGGTVHVIVNNQIGFTTPPEDSRSTRYCTDVAKMLECPIFHVNGHDPEAVAHVVAVAMEYRARFHNDVVVDVWGFRKYGHNEADEPSFTQPVLYRRIAEMPSVYAAYGERLTAGHVVTAEDLVALGEKWRTFMEGEWAEAKKRERRPRLDSLGGVWRGFTGGPENREVEPATTGVSPERLLEVGTRMSKVPSSLVLHPKIRRLLETRLSMVRGERALDWATAELLAFGTLVREGRFVRLSGQDSGRGTFSQRHAALADQHTGEDFLPLQHLHPDQAPFKVYDSPLSEAAVLGFEFGVSLDYPEALVLWEAQFGDFANGAQVLIDQFLAASEDKWRRLSGLVLLLPHGYEGQGPEHSSARLERFLQLCAEDNLIVAQPTTPAQYFHLLRRQASWTWKKPLVVMTPKSLLRLPAAGSPIGDLAAGRFERVLDDPAAPPDTERALLCSGKVYYDLVEERTKKGDPRTAIVRLEQLYPWPAAEVKAALARWPSLQDVAWVQEEPANMGGRQHVVPRLREELGRTIREVSRVESASTATGSAKAHAIEQRALVAEAFQASGGDSVLRAGQG